MRVCDDNNNNKMIYIPCKFAKAANAHLVDSSEEESFQFIFKYFQ